MSTKRCQKKSVLIWICGFVLLFQFGLTRSAESQYGASSPFGVPQAGSLSAKDAFDLAAAQATHWQADAVLSVARCNEQFSLDGNGKSPAWSFEFYSPRANSAAVVQVQNGRAAIQMSQSSSNARIPLNERIIWNSKRIYETALREAGNPNPSSYAISMALMQDPDGTPVWYVYFTDRYSHRNALVQRIHARNGQLIDSARQ